MTANGGRMQVKKSFYTTLDHSFQIDRVEDVVCNFCQSSRYRQITVELQFGIRQCSDCGLIYVSPQPVHDELTRFYDAMYSEPSGNDAESRSLGHVERHLSGLLAHRRPGGGRLLEIGCGYGRFIESVSGQAWQITAIDASQTALDYARSRVPKAQFRLGTLENLDFPPESQDCIVLIAVLEHVKDPGAAIARLTRWLAPGGLLVIQVPYIGPFLKLKRWLPSIPINFEAPRHLYDFSPGILTQYLRRAGYGAIHAEIARPYASPTRFGAYLIWSVKLVGLALYHLSGRRYIYPFASAIVAHGVKDASDDVSH